MALPRISRLNSLQLFQAFRYGSVFINSIFIARLVANQALIGDYEFVIAIAGAFTTFWVSGIINSFIPYYHAATEEIKKVLIANVFILLSVFSLTCVVLLWLMVPAFVSVNIPILRQYLLFTLFSAPAFLTEYIFVVRHRNSQLLLYGCINFCIQIAALALPLFAGLTLQSSLSYLVLFGLLRYLYLLYMVIRTSRWVYSPAILTRFFAKSWPVMLSLLMGNSMPYIDSILLYRVFKVNKAAFAVYQYGARGDMPLVVLMANALSNIGSAEIAKHFINNELGKGLDYIKTKGLRLMHILYPVTWVLLLCSNTLFVFFFKARFGASSLIFNILLLQIINRLIFPQTVIIGIQQNRMLLISSGAEWILNLVLNFVFYYWLGIPGIVYATVFAFCVERSFQVFYLRSKGIHFKDYTHVSYWLVYSLITIVLFVLVSFRF